MNLVIKCLSLAGMLILGSLIFVNQYLFTSYFTHDTYVDVYNVVYETVTHFEVEHTSKV